MIACKDVYVIPEGLIGIAGYPLQFRSAERHLGPLPPTCVARCPSGHEIRFFRIPRSHRHAFRRTFEALGLWVLPPGTKIPVTAAPS